MHALMDEAALACAIGARMRRERAAHGWTPDQRAEFSTVGRGMIISIEQGEANPSVATLLKLSDARWVGQPAVVEPPQTSGLEVMRNVDGATLWTSDAGGRSVLLGGTNPPDVIELWEWTLGTNDVYRSEAHSPGTKELSVTVESGDAAVTVRTGDSVTFQGDIEHAYLNPSRRPAKFALAVFEPGVGPKKGR